VTEEWRIEKLVPGGAGMARLGDGRVGFATGALPNERIAVEASRVRKGYVEATRFRIVASAPERVSPPCAFVEACGGCDFLHVDYDAQLRLKAALLREALERTGGFRELGPIEVQASPERLGYRSRVRVHIDAGGRVGFFARKSHRLVAVTTCAVARPELDEALAAFRALLAAEPRLAAEFEQAELRVAPGARLPGVHLSARSEPRAAAERARRLLDTLAERFSVTLAGVPSNSAVRWPLDGSLGVWVPPEAFVQVNWEVNVLVGRALARGAIERGARTFVELYAGAGNFTVVLLAAGLSGTAIENRTEAVAAARRSLEEQGLGRGVVVLGDAVQALAARARSEPLDLAVLDPPRTGALELVEPLARAEPRFIAYCSCDPVTLARDARALVARGYALESVRGFDMFPGTHHVEALAWLRRTAR